MKACDAAADLHIREQLARIDRAQAETRKFAAEQEELTEKNAGRLWCERWLPIAGLVSGLTGLVVGIAALITVFAG